MASSFPVRTLTIASSHIYSYIYLPPNSSKPTILFLHGFPCTTQGWRKQISYFFALGYGILAPDLLGYGGTSKPDSVEKYNPKAMAAEVIQILAHEKIDKVTGVGHDWASRFLSRIANYYPDRLHAIAFLSVGYAPPAQKFDLDAAKDLLTRIAGYTPFGYWKFFATDEAAALIKKHASSFYSLVYAKDSGLWKEHFGPTGALESWLNADKHAEIGSFVTEQDKREHDKAFGGDYSHGMRWYRNVLENCAFEEERASQLDPVVKLPALIVLANRDAFGIPALQEKTTTACIPDLRVKSVDAGHWLMLEKEDEVNKYLQDFFEEIEGKVLR